MPQLKNLKIKTRLVGAGVAMCVLFGTAALVASLSLRSTASNASQAKTANVMERYSNQAYAYWLTDDDQSNMYVALAAQHSGATQALEQATYRQAIAAYRQAVALAAKASAAANDPVERRLTARIRTDLPAYQHFTQEVHQLVGAGHVARAEQAMTVGNSGVSNDLMAQFRRLTALEAGYAATAESASVSTANSGLMLVLVIAGLSMAAIIAVLAWVIRSW